MKLDAHQHFWNYNENPNDYVWMSDKLAALRQNFLPDDLAKLLQSEMPVYRNDMPESIEAFSDLIGTTINGYSKKPDSARLAYKASAVDR